MSRMSYIFLSLLLLLAVLLATTPDATARSIKAYYNGQEATVENVSLHVGEPFTVDLYIVPDGDSFAYVTLTEPGYTMAYDRIAGDAIGDTLTRQCNESNPARFNWTLAPNENWVGGIAPVNIHCQLNHQGDTQPYAMAYFTVVDAEILPELPTAIPQKAKASTMGLEPLIVIAGIIITITLLLKNR